ncbi:hypothetical protein JNUCC64_30555 [Streptomyces sp. JNUCC 64]
MATDGDEGRRDPERRPDTEAVRAPDGEPTATPHPTGGEPACLLHLVCAECGRLAPDPTDRHCARCGEALPS